MKIILIACSSKKDKKKAKVEAKDRYTSALFRRSLEYAEAQKKARKADAIYILSAKYGLLGLEDKIPDYDKTLNKMSRAEAKKWARRVLRSLAGIAKRKAKFTFLAGERYRRDLCEHLKEAGHDVDAPVEGRRIGEQLRWLKKKTPDPKPKKAKKPGKPKKPKKSGKPKKPKKKG